MPLSIICRLSRPKKKKINKEISDLNNTINQMYLTDIYRTYHTTVAEYTFFSSTHRTFSRIEYMLDLKS